MEKAGGEGSCWSSPWGSFMWVAGCSSPPPGLPGQGAAEVVGALVLLSASPLDPVGDERLAVDGASVCARR